MCVCVCVCVYFLGQCGLDGKKSACTVEDPGLIPGSGRSPEEENGNQLQHSCLGNSINRSPVGYSPWGLKGLDMTEQLTHTHKQTSFVMFGHLDHLT